MPVWEHRVTVNRPIDEIWDQLVDVFNAPRLGRREGLLSMRETSPGPRGLGSTYTERRLILGFETRLTARITEWDPPRALAVTMEGKPFRSLVSRYWAEPKPDGSTEIHSRDEFELRTPLKLLWPLMGPFLSRRRAISIRELKATLESAPQKAT